MNNKIILKAIESSLSVVIVGSSPLLLLCAIALARKGKHVTIICELKHWGGSWQFTDYKGNYSDKACHLLESYKKTYDIMRSFNIDLIPRTGNSNPIKLIENQHTGDFKLISYHSKINIIRDFAQRILVLSKVFVFSIILLDRERLHDLILSMSDLWLFLRHRLCQLLNLEPVNMPREGWPSFLRSLTEQVVSYDITVVNDFVTTIEKYKSSPFLKTLGGLCLNSDLVVVGQSTFMQDDVNKSFGVNSHVINKSVSGQRGLKKYPHFLVEVLGLPARLDIPCYIHLPSDSKIHRITTSFESGEGNHCLLVQVRRDDIDADELSFRVLQIMNKVVTRIHPDFASALKVSILERYEPLAICLQSRAAVKHSYDKGILVLRTIGDLSRNIAHYHDSLFAS